MHDGPDVPNRRNVLGRLRDWWDLGDDEASKYSEEELRAAEPRRVLIPDYEPYKPPRSRWEKPRSDLNSVQFVAFIVTLCLATLLVLTLLIAVIAQSRGSDIPWLYILGIISGVGALISCGIAFPKMFEGSGEGGGGG